jgi:choline dehydrogenase-like flavoprotein
MDATLSAIGTTFVAKSNQYETANLLALNPKVQDLAMLSIDPTEFPAQFLARLQCSLTTSKLKQIKILIAALNTSIGTFLLGGSLTPFSKMTQVERENMMSKWFAGIKPLRAAARLFLAITLLHTYGTKSSCPYSGIGYSQTIESQTPKKCWKPEFQDPSQFVKQVCEYDVIVIGSGAGGGVVANQLSLAGFKVLVVDKAKYTSTSELPLLSKGENASLEHFFEKAGFLVSEDSSIQMLAGTAWGGGTAVNWSASLELPPLHRQEWALKYGLEYYNTKEYQADIDTCKQAMGITTAGVKHNVPNQILLDGCKKAGYEAETIPQNCRGKSHQCGWCTFGCPYDVKQSSMLSWIKEAQSKGCHLLENANTRDIIIKDGKALGVRLEIDGQSITIKSKIVVASCGAINTPALLLRSKISNQNIGKNLKLHPVLQVAGYFPGKTVNPYFGSIMTSVSRINSNIDGHGYGGLIEVMTSHPSIFGLNIPWKSSFEHKKKMIEFNSTATFIGLLRDKDSIGTVKIDSSGDPIIDWKLGKQDEQHLLALIQSITEIMLAAGATKVRLAQDGGTEIVTVPKTHQEMVNTKEFKEFLIELWAKQVEMVKTPLGSAHQMASCRMGIDPLTSVVKPTGESWDVQNLYIADSSVFPTASGVK